MTSKLQLHRSVAVHGLEEPLDSDLDTFIMIFASTEEVDPHYKREGLPTDDERP